MEGILKQFIAEVAPIPVLIVPIPTYEFFIHGVKPVYQPLFESLADAENKVFVADATTPLVKRPWAERNDYIYKVGSHFKGGYSDL